MKGAVNKQNWSKNFFRSVINTHSNSRQYNNREWSLKQMIFNVFLNIYYYELL